MKLLGIPHAKIERNLILLAVLTLVTVSIGGLAQIVPLCTGANNIERGGGIRPDKPLGRMGRKINVPEGCYNCHRQMMRPLRDELEGYGHFSLAPESM